MLNKIEHFRNRTLLLIHGTADGKVDMMSRYNYPVPQIYDDSSAPAPMY